MRSVPGPPARPADLLCPPDRSVSVRMSDVSIRMNAGPPGTDRPVSPMLPPSHAAHTMGTKAGGTDNPTALSGSGPREVFHRADHSASSGAGRLPVKPRNFSDELRFRVKPGPDSDGQQQRCSSSEVGTWPRTSAVTEPRAAPSPEGPRASIKLCGPEGCFLNRSKGMVVAASRARKTGRGNERALRMFPEQQHGRGELLQPDRLLITTLFT